MAGDILDIFFISLSVISLVILASLLLSKRKHRITFPKFWYNVMVLIAIIAASKISTFYGFEELSELLLVVFSGYAMLLMLVSFVLHYPQEDLSWEISGKK